jgi:hypothetical protein
MTEPEPGRWYDLDGRPQRVLEIEGDLARVRAASGIEQLLLCDRLGAQVADGVPGVTEPCLVCNGREVVSDVSHSEGYRAGEPVLSKPCPNCRALT